MDAAVPADSGLRKSSGEIYGFTDLGLALGGEYKGTKEGDPADSLKTNPNKPYNPYLDPENTGTDSAGRVWVEPELKESGADVKSAGLDPQSLGNTAAVITQVVAMLKGGEVTPENGPRIDQALERRLKKNPSPEEVSHLQDLRAQVKDAAGISDWRSQRREKYRSAASDTAAAETARARKPVTSLSSMGIGQEE
jgi:hypothetical protein